MKKIALVLITLFILTGCKKDKTNETESTIDIRPIVKTRELTASGIKETIRLSGDVVVSNSVDIFPDVAGKVKTIKVSEGDYVQKGDIVAYIDRNKPGMNFALSPVESPISGTITAVIANLGAMSAPSMPLFKVGTLDKLELETHISERDISRVKIGQRAILTSLAYPGKEFIGTVNSLNPVVNPVTRSMKVTLSIDDSNGLLKPGMFVNMKLITKERSNTIVVNREILINRNGKNYLWLFNGGRVYLKEVELGLLSEKEAEIVKGLNIGDTVVIQGFTYLENEGEVRTLNSKGGI